MPSLLRTFRVQDGRRIDGVVIMAFIHNVQFHLAPLCIFADGMIDCWGLVDFEGFKEKVRSGWVVTQPPEGAEVSVSFLASFRAVEARYWIDPEEFVKEVADEIEALNRRPTAADRCREAWAAYEKAPNEEARERLRAAYEAVPVHNRRYVLHDMDCKDGAIRRVLYPAPGVQ